jgi:hypothetical protein
MFIEIDNFYTKEENNSYFIKDENRKLYIRPKDVRYLNGSTITEIVLYSGDRFYTGTSIEKIKELILDANDNKE